MVDPVAANDQAEAPLDEVERLALRGLQGRLSPDEAARLDALCAASPEALARVRDLGDVWMLSAVAGVKTPSKATLSARPDRRWVLSAAVVLVAAIGLGVWAFRPADSIVYAAPSDSVRIVALADGSQVTLSRGSRMRVEMDGRSRTVDRLTGEAFFDVAHDAERPFVITTGEQRLTVLGTRFNVTPDPEGLRVDLLDGRLRVEPLDGGEGVILEPGQGFRQHRNPGVVQIDIDGAAAWTEGRLVFDDVPLAEVASGLLRHTGRTLSFASPEVARLRFSGVLRVDRPQEWTMALESVLPVRTTTVADGIRVSPTDG
ncbi:FecR family protein [Brevundimonas sp.]|uniref:FecR family protein n=1 Tax=Brevundimonas sp. TaxID=1871086 RepID=UPI003D0EDB2B